MILYRNTLSSLFLAALLLSTSHPVAYAWLFTLPEGSCSSLMTCQDCVVEYAQDGGVRRPCTWCPGSETCQMMNHYTGYCAEGAANTYRDICPIVSDLSRCVTLAYSFWVCADASPQSASQCGAAFADGFCSKWTTDRCDGK